MLIKQQFYRLKSWVILQFCNQAQPQIYLKNCVFVSNEVIYLTLPLFSRFHKCQFVNNKALFFTIHSKMLPKTGGNQIHGRRLGVHLMKIESTAVEMFWIAKMVLFWANMEEKCREKIKSNLRLKYQLMKRELYVENWIFKARMEQIRTTKRK